MGAVGAVGGKQVGMFEGEEDVGAPCTYFSLIRRRTWNRPCSEGSGGGGRGRFFLLRSISQYYDTH